MRRRGTFRALSSALLAVLLPACASGPVGKRAAAPQAQTAAAGQIEGLRAALRNAEQQVSELETRLAARDRDIASVRAELEEQRARERAARRALSAMQRVTWGTTAQASPSPAAPAAAPSAEASPAAAAAAATASGDGQQLAASLRAHLEQERAKRRQLEGRLLRLQQETAAGPFENGPTRALREAREEIARLKATLEEERRAREGLARRYAALQEKVRASAGPASGGASEPEEIAALRARQEKALASIRRELAASQQREQDLRQTLQTTQGPEAVSLAEAISNVRSENSALQVRLDEEHQHNRELSAKLKLAMRVTDLIFKMQAAPSTAGVAPEALSP
jgi:chromosome segregation protein